MRDKRFIAQHREGTLTKEHHFQMLLWSCLCAEHSFTLIADKIDLILINALTIGRNWTQGLSSVGDARKASVECHSLARELSNPVDIAIARACGHAVATAHMADHSLGGAIYSLKAFKFTGQSIEIEREWQNDQLPLEISEFILFTRTQKEQVFKSLRN